MTLNETFTYTHKQKTFVKILDVSMFTSSSKSMFCHYRCTFFNIFEQKYLDIPKAYITAMHKNGICAHIHIQKCQTIKRKIHARWNNFNLIGIFQKRKKRTQKYLFRWKLIETNQKRWIKKLLCTQLKYFKIDLLK